MIRVSVVDSTGEALAKLVDTVDGYLRSGSKETSLLPRVSVRPVSPQEIKFAAAPDICIIGPTCIEPDLTEVARIKKLLPHTPVIVQLSDSLNSLSIVEQLANLGADDVLSPVTGSHEFLRKLILLSRRSKNRSTGKLIVVDGGKGGVGVTSIVAALGEAYLAQQRSVALIDLDFESQDLSRFLQARPFINENLRLLLDEERPVTEETVLQTLSRVWQDEEKLVCMTPASESDDLFDSQGEFHRTYVSIIEMLDQRYDIMIVDIGSAHGVLKRAFYRIADSVLFVVNNDAASVYASVEKLQKIRSAVGATCAVHVIENDICAFGLAPSVLKDEFLRAARIEESQWISKSLPLCKVGLRWPGSGATLFSSGKPQLREALLELTEVLGGLNLSTRSSPLGFLKKIAERFGKKAKPVQGSEQPLLTEPQHRVPASQKQLELPQAQAKVITFDEGGTKGAAVDDWEDVSSRRFVSGVK